MKFAIILLIFLLTTLSRGLPTYEVADDVQADSIRCKVESESLEVVYLDDDDADGGSDSSEESSEDDDIPEYICKFSFNDYCTFTDLSIDRTYPNWIGRAEDPERTVEKVQFTRSNIEHLTSDLCDSFPDLKEIRLGDVGLEEVDDDAFFSCADLRVLRLDSNRLKALPDDLFLSNINLTNLVLASNRLTSFNVSSLQNCRNLYFLDLENNYLTTFDASPEAVDFLGKLENLDINTNDLSYLNEVGLLEAAPALSRIWINQNEFSCSRVMQMMASFKARGVKVETSLYLRKRFYELDEVEGINCLPDVSWAANLYKKSKEREEDLRGMVREEVKSALRDFFDDLLNNSSE